MFKFLGMLVALYTCYAAHCGEVYEKARFGGCNVVSREETPVRFWVVITIYAGLSLALVFVF